MACPWGGSTGRSIRRRRVCEYGRCAAGDARSEHVANLSFYYYKNGFEARIAGRYRSEFATELGDTDRILFTAPETVVDFQTSYAFPEGSRMSGVELLFQANNLTDEPFETYYGDTARQGRYESFGRRFFLGATYRFGG